jgi:ABC-type polysaccharide/polyol phosphate transport system ATPase subunit
MTHAVLCEAVWKSYHLHRPVGLKALVVGSAKTRETRFARQWALSDVSFRVSKGQAFGVLGHNGSGKTTLLSMLLGTVPADRGRIELRGRVASLLELGAGFHGDLTGEENIFLYASILGMSLKEIRERLPAIIEFSELENAVETPLRTYSAGMMARLGFAIIAHCSADILLIDEVLAVGDARFQAKCRDYLRGFKQRNGTLIIVSHNMRELASLCDEGVCLELGRIVDRGPIESVIAGYNARMAAGAAGKPAVKP